MTSEVTDFGIDFVNPNLIETQKEKKKVKEMKEVTKRTLTDLNS